jgi:membrane protein
MKGKLVALLKESIEGFNSVNGTLLAASISFSLLLSLFPLAFIAVYGAGSITGSKYIQEQVIQDITYLLPEFREVLTSVKSNAIVINDAICVAALIGLIWGGMSLFNSVRVSLNIAWGIGNPHSIFRAQLINLLMMFGAGILLLLSVMLTIMLSSVYNPDIQVQGTALIGHSMATRILANVLVTLLTFLVFLLLYKYIPNIRLKWKDIWIGALVAAISFEITKFLFIGYVRIFKPYNLAYGSIATVVAFLMWAYLSTLIFLFIAKIMYVNLKMRDNPAVSD